MHWSAKQAHRKLFADKPANFETWERHRSANWRYVPQPLVLLRVALGFLWHVVLIVAISVGLGLYVEYAVPRGAPNILIPAGLQVFGATVTFVLSLLLVFKTNSSYGRWWEARTLWGRLVAYARNHVRLAAALLPADDEQLLDAVVRWTAASVWACRDMVRQGADLRSELQDILQPDELQWLLGHRGRCLACSNVLSNLTEMASISHLQQQLLHEQINEYVLVMGGCARIFDTPIPQAYERHTVRYLSTYLMLLPLLLWGSGCGWATPALAAIVAFLLLATENIGAQIEDPFQVLPLTASCNAVNRDLFEMTAQARASTAVPQGPPWLSSGAVRSRHASPQSPPTKPDAMPAVAGLQQLGINVV